MFSLNQEQIFGRAGLILSQVDWSAENYKHKNRIRYKDEVTLKSAHYPMRFSC
jgi:hypothetical protein